MATKESKAIKRLKKQVKQLNARVDDMSREMKGLRGTTFSEMEVERADERTEAAEEIEDMLEKKR